MASTEWHQSQFTDDWYSEQFPEAKPPEPPKPIEPDIALSPRKSGPAPWFKALQRFILSILHRSGLITVKVAAGGLRGAYRVWRVRLVQQLFTLLVTILAAVGLYFYYKHTQALQLGGRLNPATSCNALHQAVPGSKSGVYWLDPKGAILAEHRPFQAYCDMSTDGGGWTLVLAYARQGSDHAPLDSSHWPLDPLGYSHAFHWSNHDIRLQYATEARFYCHTAAHPRVIHFKIQNMGILRSVMADNGYVCRMEDWQGGTQLLEGHTAHLPKESDSCWNGVLHHPFFKGHGYHWNIRYSPPGAADSFRWECDDLSGGDAATVHQIWVR